MKRAVAAKEERVSLNPFVMLPLAEKVATLQTLHYLEQRAVRGSREQLLAILAKVPDVEPEVTIGWMHPAAGPQGLARNQAKACDLLGLPPMTRPSSEFRCGHCHPSQNIR